VLRGNTDFLTSEVASDSSMMLFQVVYKSSYYWNYQNLFNNVTTDLVRHLIFWEQCYREFHVFTTSIFLIQNLDMILYAATIKSLLSVLLSKNKIFNWNKF
jgi:hypothetical protein